MRSNVKVVGFEELLSDIGIAKEQLKEVMQDTIEEAGLKAHEFAVRGIQTGPATGRIYEKYNPRRTHQASRGGEFPMSDTGRLAASVEIVGIGSPVVSVGTNVRYGRWLEFGTSEMLPRPWLFPSAERASGEIVKEAKEAFAKRMGGK